VWGSEAVKKTVLEHSKKKCTRLFSVNRYK